MYLFELVLHFLCINIQEFWIILVDYIVVLFLTFGGIFVLFSIVISPVYTLINSAQMFPFLHILTDIYDNSYSAKCELICHCGFDLHFPDNRWLSAFFHVPIGHLYAFFEKMSVHTVCPFNWNVWFFDIELWLLWIVWMLTLYWTYCLQTSSPI